MLGPPDAAQENVRANCYGRNRSGRSGKSSTQDVPLVPLWCPSLAIQPGNTRAKHRPQRHSVRARAAYKRCANSVSARLDLGLDGGHGFVRCWDDQLTFLPDEIIPHLNDDNGRLLCRRMDLVLERILRHLEGATWDEPDTRSDFLLARAP